MFIEKAFDSGPCISTFTTAMLIGLNLATTLCSSRASNLRLSYVDPAALEDRSPKTWSRVDRRPGVFVGLVTCGNAFRLAKRSIS